jgi:hypothetical protein
MIPGYMREWVRKSGWVATQAVKERRQINKELAKIAKQEAKLAAKQAAKKEAKKVAKQSAKHAAKSAANQVDTKENRPDMQLTTEERGCKFGIR